MGFCISDLLVCLCVDMYVTSFLTGFLPVQQLGPLCDIRLYINVKEA